MSHPTENATTHEKIETNNFLMIVLIILVISIGGLAEILPLYFQKSTVEPIKGVVPYPALQLVGRDIYVREGCGNCHSQMIRPFRSEALRYGHHSVAGEFVYDRPFLWGSKRTGPDLHRVGGRYSDEWHRIHLTNPRDLVPESNMPGYPWLETSLVSPESVAPKMRALKKLGVPYTSEEIDAAAKDVEGRSEMDAVIAYLQGLGRSLK
jgi:cytochrome c oxidase cbb3-type subunit II